MSSAQAAGRPPRNFRFFCLEALAAGIEWCLRAGSWGCRQALRGVRTVVGKKLLRARVAPAFGFAAALGLVQMACGGSGGFPAHGIVASAGPAVAGIPTVAGTPTANVATTGVRPGVLGSDETVVVTVPTTVVPPPPPPLFIPTDPS